MHWLAMHADTLIGLIWMIVLGPAVGNYACSVVYRLPIGKTPFERHPFCGHCNADLKPIDLFPIFSWLSTKGKCRYCKGIIPSIYTVIEVLCGLIFVVYFLHFGVTEKFLLYTAYGVFVVILAAINWQQGWIASTIYSYAFAFAMMGRVLTEHTIYGVVQSSVVMLVLALVLYRAAGNKQSPLEKPWIWWFVLMGSVVPMTQWVNILPIFLMKYLVPKQGRVIVYTAGALTLPLILR